VLSEVLNCDKESLNNVVTMDKWDKIREYEISEGEKLGKPKEKIIVKE